jgi:LPXTG-motif cell wall-anchored protein
MYLVWAMGETHPEIPTGYLTVHHNMGMEEFNFIKTGSESSWLMWTALFTSLVGLTYFVTRRKWRAIRSRR